MQIDSSFLCEYTSHTSNEKRRRYTVKYHKFVRLSFELTAHQLARQGVQDQSMLLDGKLEATWQLLPADVTLTTLGHSLNIVVHAEPN